MKYNKLKKLVKLIVNQTLLEPKLVKSENFSDFSLYDELVSDKLKIIILNLLDYNNNINININNNSFQISTNYLSSIKKDINKNQLQKVTNDNDYFSVEIIKDFGFTVNKAYNTRAQYLDSKIYSDILPIVTEKLKQINSKNFTEIFDSVMKESGLMRDNNIDNLLN